MSSSSIDPNLVREKKAKEGALTRPKLLCILNDVNDAKIEICVVHEGAWGGKGGLGITGKNWDSLRLEGCTMC